jgi:hypothetical protein
MDGETGNSSPGELNRRRLLGLLGTLGVTAVAGCGGDGDDTATPADTTEPSNPQPTTGSDTETPTETDTETPTPGGCSIPDPPDPLVSFDGIRDGAVLITPGSETMTGRFTNPYLGSTLESGSVELDVPEGNWTIEPASGTTFETLASQASTDITWNVSIPQTREEFDVTAMVTYSCGGDTYEAEKTRTVRFGPETPAPGFTDFDVADDAPARSVIRHSGHFTPLQIIPGGNAQMVYFTQDAEGFQAAVFGWEGQYDDGGWHHCVASYDAAEGLRGYIDGEQVVEQSEPVGELQPPNPPFGLAASLSNPVQELYEGALDELAVYDTALSAEQAATLADGNEPAEDSLVSKWTFDEVVFDRVEDQVGDNTMFLANSPGQVSGQSEQAVQFDGEETYAGTPNVESLNITEEKSMSFWFNTTQSV